MLPQADRREEALTATRQAMDIRRRLADTNPDAFEPDLATSLNNLGLRLEEMGRREEALTAAQDAVDIRRRLAETSPAAFEPDLAKSLRACAWVRVELRTELAEAFDSIRESAGVYRRLAAGLPHAFTSDLSASLITAADVLDGVGRLRDALALRHLTEAGALEEAASLLQEISLP